MQPSFIFSSICIFRCISLPLRLLKLAAAWGDSEPHRMPASSWKSPGAESSVFLTLSYLEHRFALLVIFWHLWITVMLSYSQLQSSRWERSQLLEALSMGEKKKSDFSIIHWKCYLWKHLLQFLRCWQWL